MLYTQTGTPYYASPEVWRDRPYDYKSDIWSLGCVLYEIIAQRPPFKAPDMKGLYKKIVAVDYPPIHSRYSSELSQVIKSMLQGNPVLRPTCDQILAMPSINRFLTNNNSLLPESIKAHVESILNKQSMFDK